MLPRGSRPRQIFYFCKHDSHKSTIPRILHQTRTEKHQTKRYRAKFSTNQSNLSCRPRAVRLEQQMSQLVILRLALTMNNAKFRAATRQIYTKPLGLEISFRSLSVCYEFLNQPTTLTRSLYGQRCSQCHCRPVAKLARIRHESTVDDSFQEISGFMIYTCCSLAEMLMRR